MPDARDVGGYAYTACGRTLSQTEPGGVAPPSSDGLPISQLLFWQARPQVAGFYDFRARLWSPELGTFLQPDQYVYLTRGGTLWSWPGNNPFRWRDPSGRFAIGGAAAAGAGGIGALGAGAVGLAGAVGFGLGALLAPLLFDPIFDALAAAERREFATDIASFNRQNQGRPTPGEPCKTEAGGGGGRAVVPPGAGAGMDEEEPPGRRPWKEGAYHGKKPGYENPGHHDPSSPNFRGRGSTTSRLPDDAAEVYRSAIPDPQNPGTWYGRNASGDYYRYQGSNDTVHWNGNTASVRGLQVPAYIRVRFGG